MHLFPISNKIILEKNGILSTEIKAQLSHPQKRKTYVRKSSI